MRSENYDKIVLDSYALIAYFEGEAGAEKVKELLCQGESGKIALLMSIVNCCEVYNIQYRLRGEHRADETILVMDQLPITFVNVDRTIAHQAAKLKARYAVAFGDCFAAALAIINQSRVLTGDPQFKRLAKEVDIYWIKS